MSHNEELINLNVVADTLEEVLQVLLYEKLIAKDYGGGRPYTTTTFVGKNDYLIVFTFQTEKE